MHTNVKYFKPRFVIIHRSLGNSISYRICELKESRFPKVSNLQAVIRWVDEYHVRYFL